MLILLIFLSTPNRIEAGRERTSPFFSEKLGPQGTIAKETGERKEKTAKKAGKMQIFWRRVENAAKTAGCERFEPRWGAVAG
jgi:hypothetical protein